ncbi:hypothetical protein [Reinekea sp.]|jgi:hypothetical protein|uniref:hypothetical protein n=1 Tax=Reinekea sp. TaxID=1970455 RepID=UPI002A8179AA|nr:hypothetical protein [Reinekea sp.]
MTTTTLWQVELDFPLALLEPSVVELVTAGEELAVPYCHPMLQSLLLWRGHWIPILRTVGKSQTLLIVAAMSSPDCPYLALALAQPPEKCSVTDRQFAHSLPEGDPLSLSPWFQCALSAVDIDARVVPIIDPALCMTNRFLNTLYQYYRKLPSSVG